MAPTMEGQMFDFMKKSTHVREMKKLEEQLTRELTNKFQNKLQSSIHVLGAAMGKTEDEVISSVDNLVRKKEEAAQLAEASVNSLRQQLSAAQAKMLQTDKELQEAQEVQKDIAKG